MRTLFSTHGNTFLVEGSIKVFSGNQLDYFNKKPLKKCNCKVLAVKGKLKHKGNSEINLKNIKEPYVITSTDNNGKFKFNLRTGVYTFFILRQNTAYLNNYDGKGNFQNINLNKNINSLILREDKESFF